MDSVAEIANKVNDSGSIAVIVGKNVQAMGIKAGNLVKDLAAVYSGRDSGRPDRAQAGAIANANNWIKSKLTAQP